MRILAIETSCDETAISIIEAKGQLKESRAGFSVPKFRVLAHTISSQIELHAAWGGVVPNLAKREHERNIIPLIDHALETAKLKRTMTADLDSKKIKLLEKYLAKEPELLKLFLDYIPKIKTPKIDAIAVTYGPGLEPALWVGINCARALALVWDLPLLPTNHMEGHIYSTLAESDNESRVSSKKIEFPALALLVSGGHTELVLINDWHKYKVIGRTRDDAVGEAFDKVARILELPYPGGPEISRLADNYQSLTPDNLKLPRPMLHSADFDFSFSGLKTAVLYKVRNLRAEGQTMESFRSAVATEFQDATIEVLLKKTMRAAKKFKTRTLVIGGGVIANRALRRAFEEAIAVDKSIVLKIPDLKFTTDNATMIAVAAYLRSQTSQKLFTHRSKIKAQGNLVLK